MCLSLFNELSFLQILSFCVIILFVKTTSVLSLWYSAGLYLLIFGLVLFTLRGDIFVGFLWVVDLGVGLIFFIFILHFSNFLYQKSQINIFTKLLNNYISSLIILLIFLYFLSSGSNNPIETIYKSYWSFEVSWYSFYVQTYITDLVTLQLLKELYFYVCGFEFFIINFMLFYGIFATIVLSFMLKKMFSVSTISQLRDLQNKNLAYNNFFIKQQNFLRQQNISTGTRVWRKKKFLKFDF